MEKQRAEKLLTRITIIPDNPSQRAKQLLVSAKVKDRAKVNISNNSVLPLFCVIFVILFGVIL